MEKVSVPPYESRAKIGLILQQILKLFLVDLLFIQKYNDFKPYLVFQLLNEEHLQ